MALTVRFLDDDSHEPMGLAVVCDDGSRVVIGRGKNCDVIVPDPSVSLRHLTIRRKRGRLVAKDEGSVNGAIVAGQRVGTNSSKSFADGDHIRIGRVWLQLSLGPGAESSATDVSGTARQWLARKLQSLGEDLSPRLRANDAACVLDDPKREYVVGRARDCDLVLTDPLCSRRHVAVRVDAEGFQVRGLGGGDRGELAGEPITIEPRHWVANEPLLLTANTTISLETPLDEAYVEVLQLEELNMHPDEFDPARWEPKVSEPAKAIDVKSAGSDSSRADSNADAGAGDANGSASDSNSDSEAKDQSETGAAACDELGEDFAAAESDRPPPSKRDVARRRAKRKRAGEVTVESSSEGQSAESRGLAFDLVVLLVAVAVIAVSLVALSWLLG